MKKFFGIIVLCFVYLCSCYSLGVHLVARNGRSIPINVEVEPTLCESRFGCRISSPFNFINQTIRAVHSEKLDSPIEIAFDAEYEILSRAVRLALLAVTDSPATVQEIQTLDIPATIQLLNVYDALSLENSVLISALIRHLAQLAHSDPLHAPLALDTRKGIFPLTDDREALRSIDKMHSFARMLLPDMPTPVGIRLEVWQNATRQLTFGYTLDLSGCSMMTEELETLINALPPVIQFCMRELRVAGNFLRYVPLSVCGLVNLEVLDISGNQLTALPQEFESLINLKRLHMGNNGFENVPLSVTQLARLQVLDVSRNLLHSLPGELGCLAQLHKLDVRKNYLERLPGELCQLVQLEELLLAENQLREIPVSVFALRNLRHLDFNDNRLTLLPDSIEQLVNLQILRLRGNRLSALPHSITQLADLRELWIGHNRFAVVPETVGQLALLETLDVEENGIASLPESIGHLAHLDAIYIDPFVHLPASLRSDVGLSWNI